MDVEPNEPDWTLDVFEDLFDFYFVRSMQRQAPPNIRSCANRALVADRPEIYGG